MIGLIAAMPEEINAITRRMDKVSLRKVGKVEFRSGRLNDEELVIALSGVGKVNAAIASTLMCQLYQPTLLISIGVAGGLRQEQNVGDLVISDCAVQADFDTSSIDGESGIGLRFDVDEETLNRAAKAARDSGLAWSIGTVATQDLFMADPRDFDRLMERFPDSACSEMEGAAVAQVANVFNIPFVILRSLSDVVVHEGNPVEFSKFAKSSSDAVARYLETFCKTR